MSGTETLHSPGTVYLVGAGPGDPELLTLRAMRAMQSADVILFDERVSTATLDFARREAKKLLVGKAGDDVTELMIGLAKASRRVVRLSGADVVDNTDDVLAGCRKAGIAIEVVPGVTSAGLKETPQAGSAQVRVA